MVEPVTIPRSGAARESAGVSIYRGSVAVCIGWVSAADLTTGEEHE